MVNAIDSMQFPDFYRGASFSKTAAKGGGVAIWCRNNIQAQGLDLQRFFIEKQFEICDISVEISNVRTLIFNCCSSCVNTDFKVFLINSAH